MKNNILVLMNARFEINRHYIKYGNRDKLVFAPLYKIYKKGFLYQIAALWMQKLGIPFQSIWYDDWKKKVRDYDVVIVFAVHLSWKVLAYIRKKNPNVRLIVWFWDSINEKVCYDKKYIDNCEVWSFDKEDCIKYGFKENTQFFIERNGSKKKNILYDAMFVGREKGRKDIISEITTKLYSYHFKIYTYLLSDNTQNGMEYDEVLDIVEQSLCIIDVPKPNQSGLTLRVLEAIFYNKKLITTNKNVVEEEFYNPQNILVWDNPTQEELISFFTKPVIPVTSDICKKYTIEQWISNFDKE